MSVVPPVPPTPEKPAMPLALTVIEMEVDVDRARPMAAEVPGADDVPAVVVRMPPYVAGALAQVLDTWALVCQTAGSDDTIEWVSAAHALLLAGREAAEGVHYPELSDLRHPVPDSFAPDSLAPDSVASLPVPTPLPAPLPAPLATPLPAPVPAELAAPEAPGVPAEPAVVVARAEEHRIVGRPVVARAAGGAVEPAATARRVDGRLVAGGVGVPRAAVVDPWATGPASESRRLTGGFTGPRAAGEVTETHVGTELLDGRRAGGERA